MNSVVLGILLGPLFLNELDKFAGKINKLYRVWKWRR